jgi:hypothetical protein
MAPCPIGASNEVLGRVQAEFMEMPGLCLTELQVRRMWSLDEASCREALRTLVEAGFLFQTRAGAFMRVELSTPLKARGPARSTTAA